MARTNRPVKLARLHMIDRRTKVGTPAWNAAHPAGKGVIPYGARKLSVWRRLHKLADHETVRNSFPKYGPSPVGIPPRVMVKMARKLEE